MPKCNFKGYRNVTLDKNRLRSTLHSCRALHSGIDQENYKIEILIEIQSH